MNFKLDLNLEGEAMSHPEAIADILERVAVAVRYGGYHPGHTNRIMDPNGNLTGSWKMPAGYPNGAGWPDDVDDTA